MPVAIRLAHKATRRAVVSVTAALTIRGAFMAALSSIKTGAPDHEERRA